MVDVSMGSMVMEDAGEGPAVVLVHGLGGTSNSFQTLMPVLSGYRVLRPDLPGAGRSGYRPGLPGMGGLVKSLKDALRAAGVDRAHFVGHSMGTLVCQHLAVDTPSLVTGLTLYGPILEPPAAARDGLKARAAAAREQGMSGIADAVSTGSVDGDSREANPVTEAFVRESLLRQDPMGYASHCEALAGAEAADHGRIGCPTLLVSGERDGVAPVAMGRELSQRIRGARLEVIAGIGHWMMIEAVDRSRALLRAHLETSTG